MWGSDLSVFDMCYEVHEDLIHLCPIYASSTFRTQLDVLDHVSRVMELPIRRGRTPAFPVRLES